MKNGMGKKILCIAIAVLMIFPNVAYAKNTVNKDESVFVTLDQSGTVKEQIVSDWIHADGNIKEIKDSSILKNIINLKGDEIPTINGNAVNWKPNDKDIFYQGTTDKSLPIEIKIKYYLNGKEIKPKDIAGKSGKIKITVNFVNKNFHSVNINGKRKNISTLFTTVALINLPIATFKNVKTNFGEVISDGNNQIITFVAFPGLKESLNIKQDIINIPQGLEIKADAKNFKLGSIFIASTPKLPDIKKFNEAKTINELLDGIKQLSDSSKKLCDGAVKLSDGQKLLAVNIGSLNVALKSLDSGAKDLKDGIQNVDKGAKVLQNGAGQVSDGVKKLSDSAIKLGEGADGLAKGTSDFAVSAQKFADGAVQAANGVGQIASKTGELSDGLNKIVSSTDQIKAGQNSIAQGAGDSLKGINDLITAKQKELLGVDLLIAGVDGLKKISSLIGQIPLAKDLADKLTAGLDQINTNLLSLKDGGVKFLAGLTKLQVGITAIKDGSDKLSAGIDNLQTAQKAAAAGASKLAEAGKGLTPVAEQLQAGGKGLADGASKLNAGSASLSSGAKQFSEGSVVLAEGANKVSAGLADLTVGTSKLVAGSTKLSDGLDKASKGGAKLLKGANDISKGSNELSANMKKFNAEGISKLDGKLNTGVNYINDLLDIKDEIIKLSKNYKTYTGVGKNMNGTVKFIFKTDEIKLPNQK